jgi:hypothetical protein
MDTDGFGKPVHVAVSANRDFDLVPVSMLPLHRRSQIPGRSAYIQVTGDHVEDAHQSKQLSALTGRFGG